MSESHQRPDSFFDPEEVDRCYRDRLCALVAREMDIRYRRREDPEDVVQSVLRTFFRRADKGEFHFEHRGALWQLLQKIARHKLLDHVAYHRAQKRTPDAEIHQDEGTLPARELAANEARLLGDVLEVILDDSGAIDTEILRLQLNGYRISEIVERVKQGLEFNEVKTFQLRLQGYTEADIADRLQCTRAAVNWRLRRIRAKLEQLLSRDSGES
jgi:RNA polymerase sigma factor (sigma-70 family)